MSSEKEWKLYYPIYINNSGGMYFGCGVPSLKMAQEITKSNFEKYKKLVRKNKPGFLGRAMFQDL